MDNCVVKCFFRGCEQNRWIALMGAWFHWQIFIGGASHEYLLNRFDVANAVVVGFH